MFLASGACVSVDVQTPARSHGGSGIGGGVGAGRSADRWSKSGSSSSSTSSSSSLLAFPPIDQHLVVPEVSRLELIDGREVVDVGALSPHADAQALTGFLLAAHVLSMYVVATELLTRSSNDSDFASDVSVRKRGIDPETGSRYLEELSFEIVNEQSMRDVTGKARNLARRGVRRVFAIFVKTSEIREWSKTRDDFVRLDHDAQFDDITFIRPIAVRSLVDSTLAEAENEVAKALIAKNNPEIIKVQDKAEQRGLDAGHKRGLDEGLVLGRKLMMRHLLLQRFGELTSAASNRIDSATSEQLDNWTSRLFSANSLEELFGS